MFYRIFILNVFVCLYIISISLQSFASEYVNWQKGNSALFVDSFNTVVEVEIEKENGSWKLYSNFAGLGALWINTNQDDEQVYVWSKEEKRIQLLVDFNEAEGISNNVDIPPCNIGAVRIVSKGNEVTVPAGTFRDVIQVELVPNCADGGVTTVWFAKSVGVIKWMSSNIAGAVTSEMVKATISGAVFPKGLVLDATFPENAVGIDMEPPVDPDAPPTTVDVNFTIRNNTGRDIVYKFNSGQKFDILLINSEGEVVSRWSRGMAFTEALELRTLRNGQIWSFGGSIELADDVGENVPGGNYTLKIELTTAPDDDTDHKSGSERISATSPLFIFFAL